LPAVLVLAFDDGLLFVDNFWSQLGVGVEYTKSQRDIISDGECLWDVISFLMDKNYSLFIYLFLKSKLDLVVDHLIFF